METNVRETTARESKKISFKIRKTSKEFEKSISNTVKKVDKDDFKIDSKIVNVDEIKDSEIDKEKRAENSIKYNKKQQQILLFINKLLKSTNHIKLTKLYTDLENTSKIVLNPKDEMFIKNYLHEFNKRQKYGHSCIDGSNLPLKEYQAGVVNHMLNNRGLL